ncbi:MAG: phosphoglycerate kinase [Chloroflexi bacterium]|nr:phosphoglycerate kinase [Chloroflexota bacterium]|tara:strand:+ start:273 stop:1442 length:1170 start_codon:yes stop_codon:yes gene_type:complete
MIEIKGINKEKFNNKRCLLRLDLNIPLSDLGEILDDTRIIESKPSIDFLINQNAKVIIISHIGRPKGEFVDSLSFRHLIDEIESRIKREIVFIDFKDQSDALNIINSKDNGTLFMLDNLRFNSGEENSEEGFINFLSSISDIYINDGFGTIHRNHASITGIANKMKSFGGILLEKEILNISECMLTESSKSTAVLGGAKISDKIPIIENLSSSFNNLIITGGMIKPFLIASQKISNTIDLDNDKEVQIAKKILSKNKNLIIPEQLICAKSLKDEPILLNASQIEDTDNIYDIGPNSLSEISSMILNSDKIIWNGPPGVYENQSFQNGTKTIIKAIVNSESKIKVAGGGSTVAAINHFNSADYFSHISTGGGAFLSLLEGKFLQGIEVLK